MVLFFFVCFFSVFMVSVCCCFKCFYWYLMTICIFLLLFFSSSNRQWFKRILSTLGYVSFHLFKTTALVWKISNGYREHCNDKPNQLAPLSSPSRKKRERKRGKNASRPAIIADNIDAPVTNKRPPISTGPHQINIKQKMCNSKRARLSLPLCENPAHLN